MRCEQVQESLAALVAGESTPDPEALERHLLACAICTREAEELARLWALLGQDRDRPLPVLARLRISGVLARLERERSFEGYAPPPPRRGALGRWRIAITGAAALIALSVGSAWLTFKAARDWNRISPGELSEVDLRLDLGGKLDEVSVSLPNRLDLTGNPQEEPLRSVLAQLILEKGARSSLRRRAVEALQNSVGMSDQVRDAMLHALVSDPNPSVRLKAADVLAPQIRQPEIQQAFLKVLADDPNPGLRVRAIDALLQAPDLAEQPRAIDALRRAATQPPQEEQGDGRYIQIRAAEFLRNL